MKGLARQDYVGIGGRTPWQRHMRNQRPEIRQWMLFDDPISEEEITAVPEKEGGAFERYLNEKFLSRREMENVWRQKRMLSGEPQEYYEFLHRLRDDDCKRAMRAFIEEQFPTMRVALFHVLSEQGIDPTKRVKCRWKKS